MTTRLRSALNRRSKTGSAANTTVPSRKTARVLGYDLSYIEAGHGDPVLFISGGPASAVMWRGPIGHLAQHARCVAVDLVGTGRSDRLMGGGSRLYGIRDHVACLEAFVKVLAIDGPLTLVLHGWGSMIGFRWAHRHVREVRAIAHMESIVRPLIWPDVPPAPREVLKRARSEEGEDFVLNSDRYIDSAMTTLPLHRLDPQIEEIYRQAFGNRPEDRRAYLAGLREIPIGGEPSEAHSMVQAYSEWLREDPTPKLLLYGEPGYLVTDRYLSSVLQLPNQRAFPVAGRHLLPEDSPDGVGAFLTRWYQDLE